MRWKALNDMLWGRGRLFQALVSFPVDLKGFVMVNCLYLTTSFLDTSISLTCLPQASKQHSQSTTLGMIRSAKSKN